MIRIYLPPEDQNETDFLHEIEIPRMRGIVMKGGVIIQGGCGLILVLIAITSIASGLPPNFCLGETGVLH
jgi:hypothetical protein